MILLQKLKDPEAVSVRRRNVEQDQVKPFIGEKEKGAFSTCCFNDRIVA